MLVARDLEVTVSVDIDDSLRLEIENSANGIELGTRAGELVEDVRQEACFSNNPVNEFGREVQEVGHDGKRRK